MKENIPKIPKNRLRVVKTDGGSLEVVIVDAYPARFMLNNKVNYTLKVICRNIVWEESALIAFNIPIVPDWSHPMIWTIRNCHNVELIEFIEWAKGEGFIMPDTWMQFWLNSLKELKGLKGFLKVIKYTYRNNGSSVGTKLFGTKLQTKESIYEKQN